MNSPFWKKYVLPPSKNKFQLKMIVTGFHIQIHQNWEPSVSK